MNRQWPTSVHLRFVNYCTMARMSPTSCPSVLNSPRLTAKIRSINSLIPYKQTAYFLCPYSHVQTMKKILLLFSFYLTALLQIQAKSPDLDLKTSLQQLQQAYLWIEHFYVDTVNNEKLSADAIRGMLKELDPHSSFLTPDEVKKMNEPLQGNFEGIGVRYQMNEDTLFIINVIIGGPSERVGLQAGDRIVKVNDTLIAGVKMTTDDIQKRLRGPKGSVVKVEVKRETETELIPFSITRDKIPVYSIDASFMVTPEVGYIKISRFAQTTYDEMMKAANELKQQGMKHLIVDLQGNGGGYLGSAVDMADEFLPANKLVVYTEGRIDRKQEYRTKRNGTLADGRLVVLIDEQSASASEIFSGAMQDLDRGVIVGRRSFGKGLVQRPVPLPGDAMMRLTVAHYYTPAGRCIQKPYTKGDKANYDKDLYNRFKNGEFLTADSIHFADSLKFYTENGRVVYGGGGIMPDLFVPLDTTRMTKTHRNIIAKGTFNKFVLNYFDKNQKQLKNSYPVLNDFASDFEVSDEMLEQLRQNALADSIRIDSTEFEQSRPVMKMQIKAGIASDLFENGAYYQIINRLNDIYNRGIEVITDPKLYNEILHAQNRRSSTK